MHTQTVIDHIRSSSPKSYRNRPRGSRTQRYLTISAGVLISLGIITFLSR